MERSRTRTHDIFRRPADDYDVRQSATTPLQSLSGDVSSASNDDGGNLQRLFQKNRRAAGLVGFGAGICQSSAVAFDRHSYAAAGASAGQLALAASGTAGFDMKDRKVANKLALIAGKKVLQRERKSLEQLDLSVDDEAQLSLGERNQLARDRHNVKERVRR